MRRHGCCDTGRNFGVAGRCTRQRQVLSPRNPLPQARQTLPACWVSRKSQRRLRYLLLGLRWRTRHFRLLWQSLNWGLVGRGPRERTCSIPGMADQPPLPARADQARQARSDQQEVSVRLGTRSLSQQLRAVCFGAYRHYAVAHGVDFLAGEGALAGAEAEGEEETLLAGAVGLGVAVGFAVLERFQ